MHSSGITVLASSTTPRHPTLLAVLAHPDDESFGMGGTLALCAAQGINAHLICATRGEAGDIDPQHLQNFASAAELRESELRCAAGILGLNGVHFLNYRDSGMPGSADNEHPRALVNASIDEVSARIIHYIRYLRPQVIVTFDPIGGYRHPDHIKVHEATLRAYHAASDPQIIDGQPPHRADKLYYSIFPKEMLRLAVRVLPLFGTDPRTFGRNHDIDLVEIVKDGNFPSHVKIDISSVRHRKDEASACHASQLNGALPRRGPLAWFVRRFGNKEYFMRAYPPAEPKLRESHLFTGILPLQQL
jgi:LmbE family N-acetylglucosaminyl deacetylase